MKKEAVLETVLRKVAVSFKEIWADSEAQSLVHVNEIVPIFFSVAFNNKKNSKQKDSFVF